MALPGDIAVFLDERLVIRMRLVDLCAARGGGKQFVVDDLEQARLDEEQNEEVQVALGSEENKTAANATGLQ